MMELFAISHYLRILATIFLIASCLNQNMITRTRLLSYRVLEIIFWFKQNAVLQNRFRFATMIMYYSFLFGILFC